MHDMHGVLVCACMKGVACKTVCVRVTAYEAL